MIKSPFALQTLADTKAFAQSIAQEAQPGDLFLFDGPLGSGKTTICRYIIQAFQPSYTIIPSPTYTILQTYDAPNFTVWHMDLYRLKNTEDLDLLGFEEALQTPTVFLIEWPEIVLMRKPHFNRVFEISLTVTSRNRLSYTKYISQ